MAPCTWLPCSCCGVILIGDAFTVTVGAHTAGGATVNVHDVAAAANVSIATVSRALAGIETVNPVLVERVWKAADELGYKPNRLAQALRNQRTRTIGVIVPDLTNPFFPGVLRAIEHSLRAVGLSLLLGDSGNDPAIERDAVETLLAYPVDALVISVCDSARSQPVVRRASAKVPVIQIDRWATQCIHSICVDEAMGVRLAISHLIDQGRRRIAYIPGKLDKSNSAERHAEFRRLLASPSRTCLLEPVVIELSDADAAQRGYEAAERLLRDRPHPDAIACPSDLAAVGVVRFLNENGVRIPDDIAVTSFDDTILASAIYPQLTSIRQPLNELGEHVTELLQQVLVQRELPARSVLLSPTLVVRGSTVATAHSASVTGNA
jgi:LacI family transcriptional regulator